MKEWLSGGKEFRMYCFKFSSNFVISIEVMSKLILPATLPTAISPELDSTFDEITQYQRPSSTYDSKSICCPVYCYSKY